MEYMEVVGVEFNSPRQATKGENLKRLQIDLHCQWLSCSPCQMQALSVLGLWVLCGEMGVA